MNNVNFSGVLRSLPVKSEGEVRQDSGFHLIELNVELLSVSEIDSDVGDGVVKVLIAYEPNDTGDEIERLLAASGMEIGDAVVVSGVLSVGVYNNLRIIADTVMIGTFSV